MREKDLQSLLRNYYSDQSLPEETAQRLRTLAEVDLSGVAVAGARRNSRLGYVRGLLIAALLVLSGLFLGQLSIQGPGAGNRAGISSIEPELIAVKIHADWCPRSPSVEPLFAELVQRYGNQPVLFVTLDITDDLHRRQAQLLVEELGIDQVYTQPFESGMIKLLDRSRGEILAVVTESGQLPQLAAALRRALPGRGSDDPGSSSREETGANPS